MWYNINGLKWYNTIFVGMIWNNMVFMVWIWIDLDSFETEETKVKSNDESAIGVYQVYHWVYLYLG